MTHDDTAELNATLKLGRSWLDKIGCRPEWSSEEFISAVNAEKISAEAKAAIVFTLKYKGEQAIAEGDALIAETDVMQAKFDLGQQWLDHIGYDTDWTTGQLIDAIDREGINNDAAEAMIFTLEYKAAVFSTRSTELRKLARNAVAAT